MAKKNLIPRLLLLVVIVEILIFVWAYWSTEPEFLFDKCARNSGRVSSLINLSILLLVGFFGFKSISEDQNINRVFKVLLSLFAVNHLLHFFYVFQNFKNHSMPLSIVENLHGFVTFILVFLVPILLWTKLRLNRIIFTAIVLHLFNVSYFIMKTFYSKVQPDRPAYHNQLGILITLIAMAYIIIQSFRAKKVDPFGDPGA